MNKMGAMNAEEMKNYKGVFVFAQQVDNKSVSYTHLTLPTIA